MSTPYRYQYDTSPRKLKPVYKKKPKKYPKKSSLIKNKIDKDKKEENKRLKQKAKVICYVMAVFAVVFTISYRNSLIDEAYSKTESLKTELSTIEKENEQLEVSIDNSLNLNSIEQSAKELLGMTELTSQNTVYVSLSTEDYIETESEQIEKEESTGLKGLLEKIKGIF